jgi:transcriptional regulator with XRE-family HTH domain
MPPKAKNPIDAAIRDRVRALNIKQRDLATVVGKSPSWANKYLSGKGGPASIDDLIRILAIALDVQSLSAAERRMLKVWRRLPPASQADALAWFEDWVRREIRVERTRG